MSVVLDADGFRADLLESGWSEYMTDEVLRRVAPYVHTVTGPVLDTTRLLAWIEERAQDGGAVRRAVYLGLAGRIRRGDFNTQDETR